MSHIAVTFVRVNLPSASLPVGSISPGPVGLIEATSKDGRGSVAVCTDGARFCGNTTPQKIGPAMAAVLTAANNIFLYEPGLFCERWVNIRVSRLFRSAPAIPGTQASGDSTHN